jgi:hypothetical protein
VKTNVTQITNNNDVSLALALLREQASREAATSAGWIRMQLKQNILDARAAGDYSVVTNTLDKLCKLDGLYAPKEHKLDHGIPDEAWAAMIAELKPTLGPPRLRKAA